MQVMGIAHEHHAANSGMQAMVMCGQQQRAGDGDCLWAPYS